MTRIISTRFGRPSEHHSPAANDGVLVLATSDHVADATGSVPADAALPVTTVTEVMEAVRLLRTSAFALAVVDLSDARTAIGAIRILRTQQPELPIAGLADPANPVTSAEALQEGVSAVLMAPLSMTDLEVLVANQHDRGAGDASDPAARGPAPDEDAVFAQSSSMREAMAQLHGVAGTAEGVCLVGEPGSGRGLLARALHRLGDASRPFLELDVADGTPPEVEQRLFGHPSRPGSTSDLERVGPSGALARAGGGTLVLRHLTALSARAQARLVRAWRDGEAAGPDGDVVPMPGRLVGLVEPGIDDVVAEGGLRADLLSRVMPARVEVPALRRRREDIAALAVHQLARLSATGTPPRRFTRAALTVLAALPYPGNARQLEALVATVAAAAPRPLIQLEDVLAHAQLDGAMPRIESYASLREARAQFERDAISAVLLRHRGRVSEAARALGIQRTNLYRKVRQLNVERSLLAPRK
ncbi:MAG: sigma 54-interacting transcriptional regulator [Vicinamibacterales bacterium]